MEKCEINRILTKWKKKELKKINQIDLHGKPMMMCICVCVIGGRIMFGVDFTTSLTMRVLLIKHAINIVAATTTITKKRELKKKKKKQTQNTTTMQTNKNRHTRSHYRLLSPRYNGRHMQFAGCEAL